MSKYLRNGSTEYGFYIWCTGFGVYGYRLILEIHMRNNNWYGLIFDIDVRKRTGRSQNAGA